MGATEMTFAEALAGRKTWIGAVGAGSLGVVEAFAGQMLPSVALLILAFVLLRRARAKSAS